MFNSKHNLQKPVVIERLGSTLMNTGL